MASATQAWPDALSILPTHPNTTSAMIAPTLPAAALIPWKVERTSVGNTSAAAATLSSPAHTHTQRERETLKSYFHHTANDASAAVHCQDNSTGPCRSHKMPLLEELVATSQCNQTMCCCSSGRGYSGLQHSWYKHYFTARNNACASIISWLMWWFGVPSTDINRASFLACDAKQRALHMAHVGSCGR
jgi:hypothetical protein